MKSRTREEWSVCIRDSWQGSVECIIEAGRLLGQAKSELEHGEYEAMIESDLPFGRRTSEMLKKVARDNRIADTNHGSHLPPSWRTLYEISRLTDSEFEEGIASGSLHSEMHRKDVQALRGSERTTLGDQQSETCVVTDLQDLVDRGVQCGTVYADPPWLYGNQSTRAATGNHYEGMTVDEIASLPIAGLAAEIAHLHLWTTNGFLFEAKQIMEAWGFVYKSCFVWVKPQMGIGNYWRVSHEFLLLGTRGSLTFPEKTHMSWLQLPRSRHSAKPEKIRHIIEKVSPGPRLELFGRAPAEGWIVWGNEVERNLFHQTSEEVA